MNRTVGIVIVVFILIIVILGCSFHSKKDKLRRVESFEDLQFLNLFSLVEGELERRFVKDLSFGSKASECLHIGVIDLYVGHLRSVS